MSNLATSTIAIRALLLWTAGIILFTVFSFNNEVREKGTSIWPALLQIALSRLLTLLGCLGLALVALRYADNLPLWQRRSIYALTIVSGVWTTGQVLLIAQNAARRSLGLKPLPHDFWPFPKRLRGK